MLLYALAGCPAFKYRGNCRRATCHLKESSETAEIYRVETIKSRGKQNSAGETDPSMNPTQAQSLLEALPPKSPYQPGQCQSFPLHTQNIVQLKLNSSLTTKLLVLANRSPRSNRRVYYVPR